MDKISPKMQVVAWNYHLFWVDLILSSLDKMAEPIQTLMIWNDKLTRQNWCIWTLSYHALSHGKKMLDFAQDDA